MKGKLKNPMLTASAIAVACMFIDDLPQPTYGTFRDLCSRYVEHHLREHHHATILERTLAPGCLLAFLPVLFLKLFVQLFFYVQNAALWDVLMLLAAHAVLASAAIRKVSLDTRLKIALVGSSAVVGGLFIGFAIYTVAEGVFWRPRCPPDVGLYSARHGSVTIPTLFWIAVLLAEKRLTFSPAAK